jgi:hypothetical protein
MLGTVWDPVYALDRTATRIGEMKVNLIHTIKIVKRILYLHFGYIGRVKITKFLITERKS